MMIGHAHLPPPEGVDPAYAPGKLVPGVHSRLVEELPRLADEAGITVQDITGAVYHLTEKELAYLREFRRAPVTGRLGIVYSGVHNPSVLFRGRSICGALIRNFIPAKLIPREALVESLFNSHKGLTAACIVVPDFHYSEASVATRRALASWLLGRAARNHQTVLGVPSHKALKEVFADDASVYLEHFIHVKGVNPT